MVSSITGGGSETLQGVSPDGSNEPPSSGKEVQAPGSGATSGTISLSKNADLAAVLPLQSGELTRAMSGRGFKAFEATIESDSIKEFDSIVVEATAGMRKTGNVARVVQNRTMVEVNVGPLGSLREGNTGNPETEVFEHFWKIPNHTNSVSGPYRTKARNAINAEALEFDTGFYRMQRRDKENVQGYLVAHLDKGGCEYISFFQESLGHMLKEKVRSRNLLSPDYGGGLTTDFVVAPVPENANGWREEQGGVRVNREDPDRILVSETPDFGVLWPNPGEVGPPRGEASIHFVAADDVMDKVMTDG